ncbi:MAG: TM0106 family RecB-like putative nuclease [Candidatus Obscuribacterales bacterium]|nr:TM0106 family RecB-like putative nuclease [Candidatus Obscuribacterales bacterium]
MNWTRPSDIKLQINKWWDRGELLSEFVTGESSFPRKIKLKVPTTQELSNRFSEVKSWIDDLRKIPNCSFEMRDFNHRILGRNSLPDSVIVSTIDDAIAIIGKRTTASKFQKLAKLVQEMQPDLIGWLSQRPHRALEHEDRLEVLLRITNWVRANPRPSIYLRQVDIPGVHTKVIEQNRGILSELLDQLLPADAIDLRYSTASQFEKRYGFLDKPDRVRFRILDPTKALVPNPSGNQDITLDIDSFAALDPNIENLFITENEVNFLAFPQVENSAVLFGSGYGFDVFALAPWLYKCRIFYWGDIDTHGFNILNSARKYLPHIRSILMDEATLLKHKEMWVSEASPHSGIDLQRLTELEHELYEKLRSNFWAPNVRLEQEKVGWKCLESILEELAGIVDQPSDVESIERTTSSGAVPIELGDIDIRELFQPSKCNLRVYLRAHQDAAHQTVSVTHPLDEFFQRQFAKLTSICRSRFNDLVDFSEIEFENRELLTAKSIVNHQLKHMYKPLLVVRTKLNGTNMVLKGEPDFLIREGDDFIIQNVKLAHSISEADHEEIIVELQFHGWLLSMIAGRAPLRLEILSGTGKTHIIKYDGGSSALRALVKVANLRKLEEEPYSPVGWSKCQDCSFRDYCWNRARLNQDVSMLPNVDQKMARILRRSGGSTINSLLQNFDEKKLQLLDKSTSKKGAQIGKRATMILDSAKAFAESRPIVRRSPSRLPESDNFAVIDFEGVPAFYGQEDIVFMWGLRMFGTNPSIYHNFIAKDKNVTSDSDAWFSFLQRAKEIFDTHGDVPFLHYHHYERSALEKYLMRFGDRDAVAVRILKNMLDVLQALTQSVALPLPSYSLKVVERYLGFARTQSEYGGQWAIAKYVESIESSDSAISEAMRDTLDQISIYNNEDIDATWAVFDWLRVCRNRME